MKQQTSLAIILRRTNYAEADRIITFLTPAGKVKAIVKGVRRSKSKLAGGVELFSESSITFLYTRGDFARVISTRLEQHWDGIVGDLQRMMFGYEVMKLLDATIEDDASSEYYQLLKGVLSALADETIPLAAVTVWFYARFLALQGHGINIKTDQTGKKLEEDQLYGFSTEHMCFYPESNGVFRAAHIKFLRLCLTHQAGVLRQVKEVEQVSEPLAHLMKALVKQQAF